MKKLSALFLIILMLLTLASCGGDKTEEYTETGKDEIAATTDSESDEPSSAEKDEKIAANEPAAGDLPETIAPSEKTDPEKSDTVKSETDKSECGKTDAGIPETVPASDKPVQYGNEDSKDELIGSSNKRIELPKIPLP